MTPGLSHSSFFVLLWFCFFFPASFSDNSENQTRTKSNQLIDPSCPTEHHPPHPPSLQSTTQATTGAQVHHPTRRPTTTLHNRSIHSKRTNYNNNNNNCHRRRRQANTIPHPLYPTNSKYNMHNWHSNNNRKTTKRASIV